jgi:hypothetical protein
MMIVSVSVIYQDNRVLFREEVSAFSRLHFAGAGITLKSAPSETRRGGKATETAGCSPIIIYQKLSRCNRKEEKMMTNDEMISYIVETLPTLNRPDLEYFYWLMVENPT